MTGGSKCSPHSSSAFSSAARTSSRPRKSARANGPGTMPVPSIMPMSMSRTPATPSSSTRHASTNAFSVKRSAMAGSTFPSGVVIEALPALGAEVALRDQLLHRLMHVEAVAVGVVEVARDLNRRVQAGHVGDAERAHRHLRLLLHDAVDLLEGGARLVLVAPDLARRRDEDAVDHEARALGRADADLADRLREAQRRRHGLQARVVALDDLHEAH